MGKTSTEVQQRWAKKTYNVYAVRLRKDDDAELIDLVDSYKAQGYSTMEIFREALQALYDKTQGE